jgi:hypothetical protein
MVLTLEIAAPQRVFVKFPTRTSRENILQIRQFLGGIRECNLRRGKLEVGDVTFLKVQINFCLGEMFPTLGLDQIFPTMQGIKRRKLAK